jgi:UDP-N-acetylmuramyl pentapeptide phosphotransferase/UDP-N-acetylglucosamine-1-phosphate transferase
VAGLVAVIATGLLVPVLRRVGAIAVPDKRSSHTVPTPTGGGLAILLGFVAGLAAALMVGMDLPPDRLLIGAAMVAIVGLFDDQRPDGVPPGLRFAVQIAAAITVVAGTGGIETVPLPEPLADLSLGVAAGTLAVVWVVGVTNFFNFLDGIDGYAATQTVIAGVGLAAAAPGDGADVLGLALAAASAGFLVHNWHPARVFMGDVGSTTIGFLLAAAPFTLGSSDRGSVLFAVALCLWFFLMDGTVTLVRRMRLGARPWDPHRAHLYQRLTRTGLAPDTVVSILSVAAALVATAGVVAARHDPTNVGWAALAVGIAAYAAYHLWVLRRERAISAGRADTG